MFGRKRLDADRHAIVTTPDITIEECINKEDEALVRYAMTNVIAGAIISFVGFEIGDLCFKGLKKILQNKK